MTTSSRCPCGKTHARLPDGMIGNVPDVPPSPLNPGGWVPPGDETPAERFRRYRDQIDDYANSMTPREHRPHPVQVVYAGDVMYADVAWDDTSLREAQLHHLYANTPVMTPERMRQIIWEDMRQG